MAMVAEVIEVKDYKPESADIADYKGVDLAGFSKEETIAFIKQLEAVLDDVANPVLKQKIASSAKVIFAVARHVKSVVNTPFKGVYARGRELALKIIDPKYLTTIASEAGVGSVQLDWETTIPSTGLKDYINLLAGGDGATEVEVSFF